MIRCLYTLSPNVPASFQEVQGFHLRIFTISIAGLTMSSTERVTRSSIAFEVGSRVTTGAGIGKKGVISFIGETQFAAGEWIGLTLDNPDGKNDGSLADVAYFTCKPLHGVFVKRVSINFVVDCDNKESSIFSNSASEKISLTASNWHSTGASQA